MTVTIRNSEGKGRNPWQIEVSSLSYDGVSKRFAVDDFRYDQWCQSECPHDLEVMWIERTQAGVGIMFEKDVDALKLINWLRVEGVAASERGRHMPG
ncbi:hypothetical protein EON83_11285 [bacterium]|nr:MAG: hypothetical protein EON83_11285 [bacterium]